MKPFRRRILCLAWWLHAGIAFAAPAGETIEGLGMPPAPPPPRRGRDENHIIERDLEQKRSRRQKREDRETTVVPYAQKRHEALRQEALAPRPRQLLLELSLIGGTAVTQGNREGYTADPTSHFNALWRYDAKHRDDRIGPWFGLRLAPFAGSGFYQKLPGTYGLTYFGPIVGVGSLHGLPKTVGLLAADPAAARGNRASDIPSTHGWALTGGVALVHREGAGAATEKKAKDNDFATEKGGVSFDAPGIWMEARWLQVLWGAFGIDVVAGMQSGANKAFIYGGIGAGAWY